MNVNTSKVYLTIKPRGRMDYESIAHEAIVPDAERSNCFSINLLIGQNKDVQMKLAMKSSDFIAKRGSLLF